MGSGYSGGYSQYGYQNQGAYANGYTHTNYPDARNYINQGRFDDAQMILDGVPYDKRDGEWYFLKGMIDYRRGWTDSAYTNFARAVNTEPSNPEFRQAYENCKRQRAYSSTTNTNVNGCGCSICDICTGLMCADCCCECMGGDCIPCC